MSISLLYRVVILKQRPRQWWDILAIWLIGMFFVFIADARKGVFAHHSQAVSQLDFGQGFLRGKCKITVFRSQIDRAERL